MVGKKKKEVSAPQEEEKQPHGRQIIEVMEGATTKEAKAALFAAGVRERTYRSYMARSPQGGRRASELNAYISTVRPGIPREV